MREDAPQREHSLRAVFNALRYLVKAGCGWRMWLNDLPPWPVVHQQTQRWIKAGCFEAMAHDLREVLRVAARPGRAADGGDPRQSHAAIDAEQRGAGGLRRSQTLQKGELFDYLNLDAGDQVRISLPQIRTAADAGKH